jgi:transcriptional regulator with GAF, ATPase, and Fis domain
MVNKDRLRELLMRVNSSDGLLISTGIVAIITGVIVDVFVIRLICLIVVVASSIMVYALMRVRQTSGYSGSESANSQFHPQSSGKGMKKLVFDDFQQPPEGQYVIGEVHEEDQVSAPAAVTDAVRVTPYEGFAPVAESVQADPRPFHLSDFFDIDSDIFRGDPEPRTEFNFLLNKVLSVVKDVLFAHSAAFFWANREKGQMVLEAKVSDSSCFISSRRFPMGEDLVSKVSETGKPELITEVNPASEADLLPYYQTPESIRSFVGVPVYFSRKSDEHALDRPVAVIAVDSKAVDEFGQETLSLLGQCTKLVSALIKSYTDKYDLLLDSELLRSIRRMQERIRKSFSLPVIVQSLSEETSKLISWDCLSVVLYDERKHRWVTKKVTNRLLDASILLEQSIDFPGSLVGQTIKNNTHLLVDDLERVTAPRYYEGEGSPGKGSFIAVPISSITKCYGALNVESSEKYNF